MNVGKLFSSNIPLMNYATLSCHKIRTDVVVVGGAEEGVEEVEAHLNCKFNDCNQSPSLLLLLLPLKLLFSILFLFASLCGITNCH